MLIWKNFICCEYISNGRLTCTIDYFKVSFTQCDEIDKIQSDKKTSVCFSFNVYSPNKYTYIYYSIITQMVNQIGMSLKCSAKIGFGIKRTINPWCAIFHLRLWGTYDFICKSKFIS